MYSFEGFPGVIGVVDGVHIHIEAPPHSYMPEHYINRKGRSSINCQMICDHTGRIRNLVAKWPGKMFKNLFKAIANPQIKKYGYLTVLQKLPFRFCS